MHGEQAHFARRARLEREVRAPAHVVFRQAERLEIAVAAIADPRRIAKPTFCTARRFVKQNSRPGKSLSATSRPSISWSAMTSAGRDAAKSRMRAISASLQRNLARGRRESRARCRRRRLLPPKQAAASASKTCGVIIHSMFQVASVRRSAAGAAAANAGERGREEPHHFPAWRRFATRSATTAGSASVEVSPSCSCSFAAILRRIRRMILPERVFGSPGAHWM